MKIVLRGHHLLCLKGFQGYGYNEDFVENMTYINNRRKQPDSIIEITDSADDICKSCPNLKNGQCENKTQNEQIITMDRKVLKHFDSTEEYDSTELFEKIDEIFDTKESVSKICSDCKWIEQCLFYQKLSNNR